MALFDVFKYKDMPKIRFRGKDMVYEAENTLLHAKIIIGMDGKLRNPWNEKVLLRITLTKQTDKLVIYIAKEERGIQDAKPIYSSDPSQGIFSDAFPVTDEELAMLRELLTKLIRESEEKEREESGADS